MNKEAFILAVYHYNLQGSNLRLSGAKMIINSRAYSFANFNLSVASLIDTIKKEIKITFRRYV